MARECSDLPFAAVPTWGTTKQDLRHIGEVSSVRLLDAVEDIEQILVRSRVVLVPSLWVENKARIITEAMLRGIPVLASDVGGNREAKLGVDYILPVSPIAEFRNELDERMMPIPVVPTQDVGPWVTALRELLANSESYGRVARASRAAALAYNDTQTIAPVEAYLQDIRASGAESVSA
jgi:glycosyltransferase involved in cell wall biosynthesis